MNNLEQIPVRVLHVESLFTVYVLTQFGDDIDFWIPGKLPEGFRHIPTFYFARQYTQIAHIQFKTEPFWFSSGILPYFKTATTLQIHSDYRVTALGYPSGIWKHQFRYLVVFQDADIHMKHVDVIFPRFVEVFHTDTDLLNA
ncbi:hypothetical protein SDC9_109540 [bioreactor metagenome]|uniref:Uncharacterized protein n=1 Tax=bioreactor metagenome TaxID=1076179 RepID=A0A645BHI4_9ZZZZ